MAKLHAETVRMLALPEVKQRLAWDGADPIGNTPQAFAEQIRRDMARRAKVAKDANIQPH